MFTTTVVVSILLATLLVLSAWGKLKRNPRQTVGLATLGVTDGMLPLLASAELAGAAGLLTGLYWWPLGVAGAVGVCIYFIGAVIAHMRKGDFKVAPALVLLVVSAVTLALRIQTRN